MRVRVAIALLSICTASAVLAAMFSPVSNRGSSANSGWSMWRQTSAQNLLACIITKET